jgi:hypothetical protein
MKGCVFLAAFFLVLAPTGYALLGHTPVRGSIGLPLVASALVTLTLTALWSVVLSVRQWRAVRPPNTWKDGALVGYSGRLSGPAPLSAPASGRSAVIYEYSVTLRRGESRAAGASGQRAQKNRMTSEAFQGAGMAACSVASKAGSFRLIGFPLLAEVTPVYLESLDDVRRLAAHLLQSEVKARTRSLREAFAELDALLDDDDGVVRLDTAGTEDVDLDPFRSAGSEEASNALAEMLHDRFAVIEERVVPQGAEVTVFGRFRATDRTIDIGGGTRHLTHAIKLGAGKGGARHTVVPALIFFGVASLLLGLLSIGILVPVVKSWAEEAYTGRPLSFESIGAAKLRAEEGARMLLEAVGEGDLKKAALLLDLNVDPNGNASGTTPIEAARDPAMLRLILRAGADPNLPNAYGGTRLHDAAQRSDVEAARVLLDAGADPNREDASGATALDEARANGGDEVEDLLLERGAVETEVTAETGRPVDINHPAVAAISEYLEAIHAQDLVRIRVLYPRSTGWDRVQWELFLESRPASVAACEGYADDSRATVRVQGPTAAGAASMILGFQLERPGETGGDTGDRPESGWRIAREWLQWPRRTR